MEFQLKTNDIFYLALSDAHCSRHMTPVITVYCIVYNVWNYYFPKMIFQASKPNDETITILKSEQKLNAHAHPSGRGNYFKSISSINMFSFSNQASEYGILSTDIH